MTKSIQELVQEQVLAKITSGEALEAAVSTVTDATTQLKEAEADAAKARREALKSGWTEAELRSLGLAAGTRARRRAPGDAAGESAAAHSATEAGPAAQPYGAQH